MPKVKDKERILKAAREKFVSGSSHKTGSWFLSKTFARQKELARNIQSDEKQVPIAKIILPSKTIIENWRGEKEFPRQEKAKGVHHHQTSVTKRNVKGTSLRRRKKKLKIQIINW